MNIESKSFLLSAAIGLAFASASAGAAPETNYRLGVAPSNCQAFTPGPSNTIRNRVAGSENIGPELALACSFEHMGTAQAGFNTLISVRLFNNSSASMTISCTNLQGYLGAIVGSTITKSVTLAAGASNVVQFTAGDTPSTTDTDLGSVYSGVNCTMPTNAIMTRTDANWLDDFA